MILEHAVLSVKPGQGPTFESAMLEARSFISVTPGFQSMEVRRCLETKDRYLLLVWWDSVQSHTQGFRLSENYARWREMLHHFYEPFPVVEHYEEPL